MRSDRACVLITELCHLFFAFFFLSFSSSSSSSSSLTESPWPPDNSRASLELRSPATSLWKASATRPGASTSSGSLPAPNEKAKLPRLPELAPSRRDMKPACLEAVSALPPVDILPPSSDKESRTLSARSSRHSGRTYDDDLWYDALSMSSGRDEWRFTSFVGDGAAIDGSTIEPPPPPVSTSIGTEDLLDKPERSAAGGISLIRPSSFADPFDSVGNCDCTLAASKLRSNSCIPPFANSVETL